jgi:hypothetical protein
MPMHRAERTPDGGFVAVDEKNPYMEVPAESVPADQRAAGEAAVDEAARELGFDHSVHIHWFAPWDGVAPVAFRAGGLGRYIGGRTRAGRHDGLWLCRGRTPEQVAKTARHEMAHIRWSMDQGHEPGHRYTPEEREATEAYADAFRDRAPVDFPTSSRQVRRAMARRVA